MLLAFAFMYYVDRFEMGVIVDEGTGSFLECDDSDLDNFCDYTTAFFNVFGYFVGGPDESSTTLDVVCSVVVVIVFLNVVIAIVSNAWDDAEERVAQDFWAFRISFLSELRLVADFFRSRRQLRRNRRKSSLQRLVGRPAKALERSRFQNVPTLWGCCCGSLVEFIDGLDRQHIFNEIPWESWPYLLITDKDMYDHPERVEFPNTKSFSKARVELWRSQLQRDSIQSFEADWKFAGTRTQQFWVVSRFLTFIITYAFMVVLGFVPPAFGFFWPYRVRRFVFGQNSTQLDHDNCKHCCVCRDRQDPDAVANATLSESSWSTQERSNSIVQPPSTVPPPPPLSSSSSPPLQRKVSSPPSNSRRPSSLGSPVSQSRPTLRRLSSSLEYDEATRRELRRTISRAQQNNPSFISSLSDVDWGSDWTEETVRIRKSLADQQTELQAMNRALLECIQELKEIKKTK